MTVDCTVYVEMSEDKREAIPGVVRLGMVGRVIVVALGGAALSLHPGPLL